MYLLAISWRNLSRYSKYLSTSYLSWKWKGSCSFSHSDLASFESSVFQFFSGFQVFLGGSRSRLVSIGLWSDPWKNWRATLEKIRELEKEEEIKDRSIAEHGFSEKDLALVGVKGVIARSRFKSFIRLWNLFAVSEYSLLFFD